MTAMGTECTPTNEDSVAVGIKMSVPTGRSPHSGGFRAELTIRLRFKDGVTGLHSLRCWDENVFASPYS